MCSHALELLGLGLGLVSNDGSSYFWQVFGDIQFFILRHECLLLTFTVVSRDT